MRICPGRWQRDGKLKYHAALNCRSNTLDEAAEEVASALEHGFLSARPPVPALNRYTKIHGPIAWWAFAGLFFSLALDAFVGVQDRFADEPFLNINVAEVLDEAAFRRAQQIRWRKASSFLMSATANQSLGLGAIMLKFVGPFLGYLFASSRLATDETHVLPFMSRTTCPATKSIANILGHAAQVLDPDCRVWAPLHAGIGVGHDLIQQIANAAWVLVGGIFIRCVMTWDEWPWPLGKLVHPDVDDGVRQDVIQQLMRTRPCCIPRTDGFTLPFLRMYTDEEAIRSNPSMSLLRDSFTVIL